MNQLLSLAQMPTMDNIDNMVAEWALNLATAAIIFFVGKWLAGVARTVFTKVCEKRNIEASLSRFAASVLYYLLMAVVIVAALGKLGVPTTSVVAILGAAGLAVGLALQGSLSNFAAGVMILLFRPFKTGDVIDGGGVVGVIVGIDMLTTEMKSFDGKQMIVPNGKFLDSVITNINAYPSRRVDIEFSISYDDDVDQAREIMLDMLSKDERVLDDPAVTVALMNFGDSAIDMVARAWVAPSNWWGVLSESREKLKKAFDANGISIPFPQQDIHIIKDNSEEPEEAAS
ncbi:mechanosensitive ion channel family protein [Puniceicoccus vermicola]|uniref:Mechanosensitive ion channel n=1 Tax=Puniceicoccus vermicola TaxID=388746 RepID=A0A7X1E6J7_9BACT|nr:mechanosensitive ion channel domain-containing protein [Puniceicoccus vermicola]MBC2604173.1 mechanosensitive ion channel [Puniceicoccus vermicola]